MEVADNSENVDRNDKMSEPKEDSVEELKSKLKRQINELKSIILQIEWSLDAVKFANARCVFDSSVVDDEPSIEEIPDMNARLKFQLYRFSGLYCVKFTSQETVFNFSSLTKYDKKDTYAVEIFNRNGKGVLGRSAMPMAVDLDELSAEIPIGELKNIPLFLKTCKQRIDAYFVRQQQYVKLMDMISVNRNCYLQSDPGYTRIVLELLGVHNLNTTSCANIIVYLFYNTEQTKPHKIQVNPLTEDKLDEDTKKSIDRSLKLFRKLDLHIAFEKMLDSRPFTYIKENDEDSPVDINNLSEPEEEGCLDNFLSERKVPVALRKRRRVRKRLKVTDYKKIDIPSPIKRVEKSIPSPTETQSPHSVQKSLNKSEQTKLKQTKLNFPLNNSKSSIASLSNDRNPTAELMKPLTSTPMHRNNREYSNIDISDITVSENNSDIAKTSKPTGDQLQSDTPVKLLQKKMQKRLNFAAKSKPRMLHRKGKKKLPEKKTNKILKFSIELKLQSSRRNMLRGKGKKK